MGRKLFNAPLSHHITLKSNLNPMKEGAVFRSKKMSGTEVGGDSSLQTELLHDGNPPTIRLLTNL
jgi:hypothetical protein